MTTQEILSKMKSIQQYILEFIDAEINPEEKFTNLINLFDNFQVRNNQYHAATIFHLLVNISDNHHRGPYFFDRIEKILKYFENEIKNFSNFSIFNLFKSNKRILLYLVKEKILTIDTTIASILSKNEFKEAYYCDYFTLEIQPTVLKDISEAQIQNYEEKRKNGENEDQLCIIIQNDLLEDFIKFTSRQKVPLSNNINPSFFETNPFLIGKAPKLIEYAAFFGSIKIFNYLRSRLFELTPSLSLYAIHSNNIELIHSLNFEAIKQDSEKLEELFEESVKCHHNEIADYIKQNFITNNYKKSDHISSQILESYNFYYFEDYLIDKKNFHMLCQNDYFYFVDFLLKSGSINVNMKYILD